MAISAPSLPRLRKTAGRLTVGLLTTNTFLAYNPSHWLGVMEAARDHDANSVCFTGTMLHSPDSQETQASAVFDLINPDVIDGLIIWAGALDWYLNAEDMASFCRHYNLPVVAVERSYPGIPGVLVDDYQGMHDLVSHLIDVHGYRRIAFIRGAEGHKGAQERYRGYQAALAAHNLPFDANLVTPPDDRWDGARGASLLFGERKLKPKATLDVIVTASDAIALRAFEWLRPHGIHVPDDVAVVGFDDIEESQVTTPPLTTVRMPFYEIGRRAVDVLLAHIHDEPEAQTVTLPMELALRRSCGCQIQEVSQAATAPQSRQANTLFAGWRATFSRKACLSLQRDRILSEVAAYNIAPERVQRLLDAFCAEMQGQERGSFLTTLDNILYEVVFAESSISIWQSVLSVVRRQTLPDLRGAALAHAENLWQQARVMIGETAQRVQAYQRLEARRRERNLREVEAALIQTLDLPRMLNVLEEGLRQLGVPGFYLAGYENPEKLSDWSRLLLAYNAQRGRIPVKPEGQRFPSRQLIPEELLARRDPYSLLVEPLFFENDQLGFAVFEVGVRWAELYDILHREISSALKRIALTREREDAENALQHLLQILHNKAQLVSTNSLQMSQRVTALSAATEELAANGQENSDSATEVMQVIMDAVDLAQQANIAMQGLAGQSEEIEGVVKVITEITSQLKLLSLNAMIEAARAGESGKGFSVVADEVKDLAKATALSAEDITRKANLIRNSSHEATEMITRVVAIIQRVAELSQSITAVIANQAVTTNEISRMITASANGSEEISRAIADLVETAQKPVSQTVTPLTTKNFCS